MNRFEIPALRFWQFLIVIAGCVTLLPQSAHAQLDITSFTLTATPNPLQGGSLLTVTANVVGMSQAPTGSVDFFLTSDSGCASHTTDLGTIGMYTPGSAIYYSSSSNPLPAGVDMICATYIPDSASPYPGATTTSPVVETVYAATVFTANAPGTAPTGVPVTFSFSLSTPSGQASPTGTVTLTDSSTGAVLGTSAVGANGSVPSITASPSADAWTATYSGDSIYRAQSIYGTVFYENGLKALSPGAAAAGGPALTINVIGQGFTSSSVVQSAGGTAQNLTTTYVSPTRLQATLPASVMSNAGTVSIQVQTGSYTSNALPFVVATPFTNSITATANPTSLVYGQANAATFAAVVKRGAATDGAVPVGKVSFTLTGPQNIALGAASLAQVTGNGAYAVGSSSALDAASGKLIAADLNGDGLSDLVSLPRGLYGYPAGTYLQTLLANGVNSFEPQQQVYAGCNPQDFAVADLNGDGHPDIVVLCQQSSEGALTSFSRKGPRSQATYVANQPVPVATYLVGNGDGTFQEPVNFASDSSIYPGALAVGDFNGDGKLDVALIDEYGGAVQIYSGSSQFGSFTANPSFRVDTTAGYIYCAAAADFNQDGKSDLALVEYSGYGQGAAPGAVLLLTSTGTAFTTASQPFVADTTSLGVAVTDVNGDGYPDLAIADPGIGAAPDTGQIFIFENSGSGALNGNYSYPAAGVSDLAGAPFPVVGKPSATTPAAPSWSLVYSSADAASGAITLTALRRQSATSYAPAYTLATTGSAQSGGTTVAVPVAVGDINGDGYLDITAYAKDGNGGNELIPFGYGNDSSGSIGNIAQQPNAGTYNLVASYPGDLLFTPGTSPGAQVIITPATPGGSVSAPASGSYGQPVTLTATVSGIPGGTVPSGTVQFLDNGTPLGAPQTLISGVAEMSTASLSAGQHTITASYNGDLNYAPVTSLGAASITISQASFSLTLTSSASSTTAGTVITFTAQGTGSQLPVGGIVTFTGLPSSAQATIDAAGRAVYRFGLFSPGSYTIQAQYGGSSTFTSAASNQVTLQVASAPVTVALTSSANPVTTPAPVALTATVTSGGLGVPTGSVSFDNSGKSVASGALQPVNGTSGLRAVGIFGSTGVADLAMATGDFNHDGKIDAAVLESGSDGSTTLAILLGNGDGTFQPPVSYGSSAGVSTASYRLTSGDFNRDGYTDLAIGDSNGTVTILLAKGDSNGDLQVSQTITGAPQVNGIATGDFNKDGNLDLVVAGGANLYVYTGSSSGAFSTTPTFRDTNEAANFTGVTVADFNQDGYADIAASDRAGPQITVLLYNPSTASFTPESYPMGTSADGIASGDFNGDKYPDLACFSTEASSVTLMLNSAGTFGSAAAYATVILPEALTAADFNGDGYDDLVVTGTSGDSGGSTVMLLGSRTGAITGESSLPVRDGMTAAAADLNGDNHPDLLVGSNGINVFADSDAQITAENIVLPVGTNPLTAVYAGSGIFANATSNVLNEVVNPAAPSLAISGILPASASLGDPATTITVAGAGFTSLSQVLLNGSPIATTYVTATELKAVIPAADLQQTGTLAIAVTDSKLTTSSIPFSVLAPSLRVILSGPGTEQPGQQPSLNFALEQGYPVPIQGTFTLTVQPATEGGPVDPAVQFASGGDTFNFTLPANSTATPTVQLQTGTLAATITVTLTLHAGGTDITPASLQPVVINVPPAAPTISSVTLARSGNTLTVTVQGFSSSREMKSATFNFTPASGADLQSPKLTLDISSAFQGWYTQDTSVQYGSAFSYVQTFTLTDDASTVQSVSVTLTNAIGNSNTRSAQ